MSLTADITVIIVTHDSLPVVRHAVEALLHQTVSPSRIVVVDSGSADPDAVVALGRVAKSVVVHRLANVGFAAANNFALRQRADGTAFFLLVNPDTILAPDWIEGALDYIRGGEGHGAGIISSPLRGMDAATLAPTERWDSLGIFRRRSGRWFDRGQGQLITEVPLPAAHYEPVAICGALMFFSREVFLSVCGEHGFFDERLIMYKEDVDLSLRVREAGLRLVMLPHLTAFHCRGWAGRRAAAPHWAKRLSARNDVIVAAKHFPLTLPVFLGKYVYVVSVERLVHAFFNGVRPKA